VRQSDTPIMNKLTVAALLFLAAAAPLPPDSPCGASAVRKKLVKLVSQEAPTARIDWTTIRQRAISRDGLSYLCEVEGDDPGPPEPDRFSPVRVFRPAFRDTVKPAVGGFWVQIVH
jgi:hypothetical protein